MKQNLIEATKELFRIVVLSVIPVLVSSLSTGAIDYRVVSVTAAIAALRFIDKLLHETGKDINDGGMGKGLTRF